MKDETQTKDATEATETWVAYYCCPACGTQYRLMLGEDAPNRFDGCGCGTYRLSLLAANEREEW